MTLEEYRQLRARPRLLVQPPIARQGAVFGTWADVPSGSIVLDKDGDVFGKTEGGKTRYLAARSATGEQTNICLEVQADSEAEGFWSEIQGLAPFTFECPLVDWPHPVLK